MKSKKLRNETTHALMREALKNLSNSDEAKDRKLSKELLVWKDKTLADASWPKPTFIHEIKPRHGFLYGLMSRILSYFK